MPESIVGVGPWRVTPGVGVEVWEGSGASGYAYHVTAGAALTYAAALYREAAHLVALVSGEQDEVWNDDNVDCEVDATLERWLRWAKDAMYEAEAHLHRVALESR